MIRDNCVYKQGEDGEPEGESLGCHDTHEEALAQMAALHANEEMPTKSWAVKAIQEGDDWILDVRGIPFGSPQQVDSDGEYFDAQTVIHEDKYGLPPAVYYHGYDDPNKPSSRPVYLGKSITREKRADGWYFRVILDKAEKLAREIWESAKVGMARASSGSAHHLVRYGSNGRIAEWPVIELSLIDTRMKGHRPANPYAIALPAAKAMYQAAGLPFPSTLNLAAAESQDGTRGSHEQRVSSSTSGREATLSKPNLRGVKMSDENVTIDVAGVEAMVEGVLQRHADQQAQRTKIEAEKRAEIEAVVKAERAQIMEEAEEAARAKLELEAQQKQLQEATYDAMYKALSEKLESQNAASRRLPGGGAPYVPQFQDTWKYDQLDTGTMAWAINAMNTARMYTGRGAPNQAYKALAQKVAEDQSELGEYGRRGLKALGINPRDALDAVKANELNYSTQSGFGDEWVPTVMSTAFWEKVRVNTFVLDLLPTKEFTGAGDTFPLPLEDADPTWYRIGQTTGTNATTGLPDSTIGTSKIGTGKKDMTLAKIGTRVIWANEEEEDSIISWAENARRQAVKGGSEQMEHLVIDGDTETGATANINHIGGTPTSTGVTQDLFLSFDSFRKLALVTNTANSRSAAGSFADTDYIETLKLMGAAGTNALDIMQTCFIQDANVGWKSLSLAVVKTQDVFSQPTIENGVLTGIYGRKVYTSAFMHYKSADRKANTAGKVDQTTTANNTRGGILSVRKDQWLLGWKRRIFMELQSIPGSDAKQLVVTARLGLVYRDTEASAITYNVGV